MSKPAPRSGHALEAVLALGGRAGSGIAAALVLASALHATMAVRAALIPLEMLRWTERMSWMVHDQLWSEVSIDVQKVAEAEPPPPPPVEEKKDEAPPPPAAVNPPPPKQAVNEPPPPPPAAAQAGQVLAQDPDPNEPVDLTNSFVQGNAEKYAGKETAANGTSTVAVSNPNARGDGVLGGTGKAPAPAVPAVDRSRKASADQRQWDSCGFPSEADVAQVDEAVVQVEIAVGPDGSASRVDVVRDPGNGFGRHAKRCGMGIRFVPALDREGHPVAAVQKFNVTFTRQ